MLSIKNLEVSVEDKKILKDISFNFEEGKTYAVMGPNGSGKSTLAYTIMGHPLYKTSAGSHIVYKKTDITQLDPDKRAEKGIFLSFQSPLSLAGVKVHQLLQMAMQGKKNPIEIRGEIKKYAQDLKINPDLLMRSLNEGASGGEKKKIEVLQAAILDKQLLIFDEVDTGVDVDSLKTIAQFLKKNQQKKTYIVITHYNRILKYLSPNHVLILINGQLKRVGDGSLADEIEKNGYEKIV